MNWALQILDPHTEALWCLIQSQTGRLASLPRSNSVLGLDGSIMADTEVLLQRVSSTPPTRSGSRRLSFSSQTRSRPSNRHSLDSSGRGSLILRASSGHVVSAATALSLEPRPVAADSTDIEASWQEQRRLLEESYHATAAPDHVRPSPHSILYALAVRGCACQVSVVHRISMFVIYITFCRPDILLWRARLRVRKALHRQRSKQAPAHRTSRLSGEAAEPSGLEAQQQGEEAYLAMRTGA